MRIAIMSNEKASIVCFEQFIEAFLTESSKSPASIANIRLTFKRAKRFIFSTRKREKACMAMRISLY